MASIAVPAAAARPAARRRWRRRRAAGRSGGRTAARVLTSPYRRRRGLGVTPRRRDTVPLDREPLRSLDGRDVVRLVRVDPVLRGGHPGVGDVQQHEPPIGDVHESDLVQAADRRVKQPAHHPQPSPAHRRRRQRQRDGFDSHGPAVLTARSVEGPGRVHVTGQQHCRAPPSAARSAIAAASRRRSARVATPLVVAKQRSVVFCVPLGQQRREQPGEWWSQDDLVDHAVRHQGPGRPHVGDAAQRPLALVRSRIVRTASAVRSNDATACEKTAATDSRPSLAFQLGHRSRLPPKGGFRRAPGSRVSYFCRA